MRLRKPKISGLFLLETKKIFDDRGYFIEHYNEKIFQELAGFNLHWKQDNFSSSKSRGTVRGLHFQRSPFSQAKLVRCASGEIFDVAVDLRKGSSTYGEWEGFNLSPENDLQLFIPSGFAHGFMTLRDDTEVVYKCSDFYNPEAEGSLHWESCGIDWPLSEQIVLSNKDRKAPSFKNFVSPFIYQD